MSISWSAIITWLIVGALAGALAGMVVKRSKRGYGRFSNFGIGLIGALIGGGIFRIFGIDLGLGAVAVSLQDLVAAFSGSLLFLLALRIHRRGKVA